MQNITAEELKQRIDNGEELYILDVREPHEREEFNIGGKHIPLGFIQQMDVEEIEGWKDKELIVYCRSGNRSGQACMLLDSMGFTNTKNLVGGMLNWTEKYK
ncbi:MAG: rhodanese-like domain-containing protein [Chitinophaga sp.]|uniref:rhodanese-like domain-containing protein n=1 Tax=Chitinophaga sp. TaxID=1869181 RepID=UPI001B256D67|nr:rhodanese-like domain-containing protein [Chitinophaga sp.]MBO9732038.1 rhodanese-like domain-containing protein [Chitinophaga sp.]